MREYNLTGSTGETVTMRLKTEWQDVTMGEFIALREASQAGKMAILTGLTEAQVMALDSLTLDFVAGMVTGMGPLPEPVTGLGLLSETIGQLETAKQHIRQMTERHPEHYEAHAAPLIYGLYKAEKIAGKWDGDASQKLAKEARNKPVTEVWPVVQGCYKEMEAIATRYAGLSESDEESDEEEEASNELAAFGFYPTLKALAGGDLLKHDAILQLSAITVYTDLVYRKKAAEVAKRLEERKKQTA